MLEVVGPIAKLALETLFLLDNVHMTFLVFRKLYKVDQLSFSSRSRALRNMGFCLKHVLGE